MIRQISGIVYYGNFRAILMYLEQEKPFDNLAYDTLVKGVELDVNNVVRVGMRDLMCPAVDVVRNILQDEYDR